MSRPTKAKQGERQTEALKAIAKFQKEKRDWNHNDLATELEVDRSQARMLIATLTLKGQLEPAEVLVKKTLPVLTSNATAQLAA